MQYDVLTEILKAWNMRKLNAAVLTPIFQVQEKGY